MISINIVGAGNVGSHISRAFRNAGFSINIIYNRSPGKADLLAKKLRTKATRSLSDLDPDGLTCICVSDDAIRDVINAIVDIHGEDHSIVHTSGSLGVQFDDTHHKNVGCIWPVQSINKDVTIDFSSVPLCIDANNERFLKKIMDVSKSLSRSVFHLPSEKKKFIHLSAVWANNFSNHVIHLAEEICETNGVSREVLYPLLSNMIAQLHERKALEIQTGPARRKDLITIEKHLSLMNDKKMKDLYRHLTESIIYTYHENN